MTDDWSKSLIRSYGAAERAMGVRSTKTITRAEAVRMLLEVIYNPETPLGTLESMMDDAFGEKELGQFSNFAVVDQEATT